MTCSQADKLLNHLDVFETPGNHLTVGESILGDPAQRLLSAEACEMMRTVGGLCGVITSERERLIDLDSFMARPELVRLAHPDLLFELLFRHIRLDLTEPGHLATVLENGHLLAILRRLRELRPTLPD